MDFCADGDSIQRLLEDEGSGSWAVGVYFTKSAWCPRSPAKMAALCRERYSIRQLAYHL